MKRECITSVFIEFSVRPTLKAFFDSIVQASDSEGRVAEPSDHNFYKCYEMQPKQADGWIILKNMGYSEEFLNEVEEKLTDGTLHTNLTNAAYHDKVLPGIALEFSTVGTSADPFVKLAMAAHRIWNTEARVESVSYDGYYYMAGNDFEAMWQHYDDPTPEQESELKTIAKESVKPAMYDPLSEENRLLQTAAIMNLHRMSEVDKIFYDWLNFQEEDFIHLRECLKPDFMKYKQDDSPEYCGYLYANDALIKFCAAYSGDAQEPLFSVDILLPEVTGYYGEKDEVDTNYDADSLITQLEKCFSAKQLINGEITYEEFKAGVERAITETHAGLLQNKHDLSVGDRQTLDALDSDYRFWQKEAIKEHMDIVIDHLAWKSEPDVMQNLYPSGEARHKQLQLLDKKYPGTHIPASYIGERFAVMASTNMQSKLLGNTLYSFDNPQTILSEQNPDWKFDFECGLEEMKNIQKSYKAGVFRNLGVHEDKNKGTTSYLTVCTNYKWQYPHKFEVYPAKSILLGPDLRSLADIETAFGKDYFSIKDIHNHDYEIEIFHNRYAAYYNTCSTHFSTKDSLSDAYEDHDAAASQVVRDMLVEGKSLEYCMDMVMNCSPIAISRQELCEDYALRIVQKGRQMAEEKSLGKNHHMDMANQR